MEWQIIIAVALAVPAVIFPAAFVIYINSAKIIALAVVFKEKLRGRIGVFALESGDARRRKERCKT